MTYIIGAAVFVSRITSSLESQPILCSIFDTLAQAIKNGY